jgi:hypothetical protein
METGKTVVRLLALAVLLAPIAARAAQTCTYIVPTTSATPQQYAANLVKLKYLGTGPGFNDDKPMLFKSAFTWATLFDPIATHTVHVIIQDTNTGLQLWSTNIPPGPLWTHPTANKWKFNDPATTYGVRKAQVIGSPGGYVIAYIKGKNTNVTNAPVTPNVSKAYVRVEIESGGVGVCYEGDSGLGFCTGAGNTQTCTYH